MSLPIASVADATSTTAAPTVRGGNIMSMLAAMGAFRPMGERILQDHGIAFLSPDAWYDLASYAEALRTIGTRMGANTLFMTGKEIPNHINLPPGLDRFEVVIGSFGPAFAMNHRGAGAGGISFEITGDWTGRITSATPYPCDFDRGVITGFFEKLLGARMRIAHDVAGPCKKRGDATCLHLVSRATASEPGRGADHATR